MHRSLSLFAALALSTFAAAQEVAQEAEWIQNFTDAKAKAKAEKKHLLIDFTGSDWCGWCIKLDEEVFSKEAFKTEAPKHFVLVKLDYPRNKDLVTEEIQKQNAELGKKYQIQGYPTILLCDCEGRVYGATGYQEGGPEKYNTHLGDMKKQGDAFVAAMVRADAAKGVDRAKALDEALSAISEETVANHHLAVMQEICTLDADGKAGLKSKHEAKVKEIAEAKELDEVRGKIEEELSPMMEAQEFDKAIARLDEMIKAPKNVSQHQLALFYKGIVIMQGKQDAKGAIAELEAALKLNKESAIGKQIEQIIPRIKKMAEEKGGEKKEEGKEEGGK
ncbi:MAG: thioredoxin family protein [Planctomycetes bacterium]|nr:thioredoxin family protein [Planctomycetota bacterium]